MFFYTLLSDFYDMFQSVIKNIKRSSTFIFSLLPNLAKSSCGRSPLQLHHKIDPHVE